MTEKQYILKTGRDWIVNVWAYGGCPVVSSDKADAIRLSIGSANEAARKVRNAGFDVKIMEAPE